METNPKNRKIWANAMRKSFFEKLYIGFSFETTSTQNRYEFRESTHITDKRATQLRHQHL